MCIWSLVPSRQRETFNAFQRYKLTLNDSQQDDDDKEEESDVKEYAVDFIGVAIWSLDLVADAATRAYTLVQVENKALKQNTNAHTPDVQCTSMYLVTNTKICGKILRSCVWRLQLLRMGTIFVMEHDGKFTCHYNLK